MHAVHRLESRPPRSHTIPPSLSPVPTSEAHSTHSRSCASSSAGDGCPDKSHRVPTKTWCTVANRKLRHVHPTCLQIQQHLAPPLRCPSTTPSASPISPLLMPFRYSHGKTPPACASFVHTAGSAKSETSPVLRCSSAPWESSPSPHEYPFESGVAAGNRFELPPEHRFPCAGHHTSP